MPASDLLGKLSLLKPARPIYVIGAAIVDHIVGVPYLPSSGDDVDASQDAVRVGGCALNVAICLQRLGIGSNNAFLIGEGNGSAPINRYLNDLGIQSSLPSVPGDNGWCLALVEPDGERTFISIKGVENDWSPAILQNVQVLPEGLIYLSGYQLISSSGETIVSWLETLDVNCDLFIDFGPRIKDIAPEVMLRLLAMRPTISVNRSEAEFMGVGGDIVAAMNRWTHSNMCSLIVRLDSSGAYYKQADEELVCVAPFSASVVDSIGAGDSHGGGVLGGLAAGWGLGDAVSLGNAVASYVVSHRGGDCAPDIDNLRSYLLRYDD